MSSELIQAKYDALEKIARQLEQRAQAIEELRSQIQRSAQPLEQGGWQGRGSSAFFQEMNAQIYPAMQRLRQALEQAGAVTLQASEIMRVAEQEAGALFRGEAVAGARGNGATAFAGASAGARASTGGGGFLSSVGSFLGSVGGGIKDFATGMWDEGKDMVVGLKNLVLHPIDTAKGIVHAVTHPGEFWDAFKKPYVEAWESGHPLQAVGRGTMFALSFALGAKGADKAAKAANLGSKAGEAGALAGKAGRVGELGEAAATAGRVGEAATVLDDAARLAQGVDAASEGGNVMRRVMSGGKRGEAPLTAAQKAEINAYARQLAPDMDPDLIRFVDDRELNTAYGANFDMLQVGSDVLPSPNAGAGTLEANSRMGWRPTIAHELVGHRDAARAGLTHADDLLEEAQASIRAARFAPDLTAAERITLLRDAIARLHKNGIKIREVRDTLHINEP